MKKLACFCLTASAVGLLPSAANAALVVNIGQSGPSVVATVSGTLSLSGLIFAGNSSGPWGYVIPNIGQLAFGNAITPFANYIGFGGPASWGPGPRGGLAPASSFSPDFFGVYSAQGSVFVPIGFASGSAISSSQTWANQTFATLGLNPGTYVYTSSGDTITVNIGNAAVPEPATWAMMLAGFGLVGSTLRRGKVRQQVRFAF